MPNIFKPESEWTKGEQRALRQIIDAWFVDHPDLCDEEMGTPFLTVEPILVYLDDSGDGPEGALMVRGLPRRFKIKVTSLKDRSIGRGDVELLVDGDQWAKFEMDERRAVVDDVLHGLELRFRTVTDSDGNDQEEVQRDDRGRPKLRIRPHDFEIAGYHDVAERHGASLPQVQLLRELYTDRMRRQQWFPFADTVDAEQAAESAE